MEEFKNGDIVQLISGGPNMTITQAGAKIHTCLWFAEDKLQKAPFNDHALKRVKLKQKKQG